MINFIVGVIVGIYIGTYYDCHPYLTKVHQLVNRLPRRKE